MLVFILVGIPPATPRAGAGSVTDAVLPGGTVPLGVVFVTPFLAGTETTLGIGGLLDEVLLLALTSMWSLRLAAVALPSLELCLLGLLLLVEAFVVIRSLGDILRGALPLPLLLDVTPAALGVVFADTDVDTVVAAPPAVAMAAAALALALTLTLAAVALEPDVDRRS